MFFSPKYHNNPLQTGSLGGAFTISHGIEAEITEIGVEKDEVFFNEKPLNKGPSLDVINIIRKKSEKRIPHLLITQKSDLPISAGLSTSGAGALATTIAVNEKFQLGLSKTEIGQIAHIAELQNFTGLGSVLTQFHTGLLLRIKAGAPGIGKVHRFSLPPEELNNVLIFSWGGLSTSEILNDKQKMRNVYSLGEKFTNMAVKHDHLTLFKYGKKFTFESGLASEKIKDILRELSLGDEIIGAGMAMLGETIYVVGKIEVLRYLSKKISAPFILFTKIYQVS